MLFVIMCIMMSTFFSVVPADLQVHIEKDQAQSQCVNIVCICVQESSEMAEVVRTICHLFDLTGQITSTIVHQKELPTDKGAIQHWAREGYDFALYFQGTHDATIRYWLYDSAEASMLSGIRFQRRPSIIEWAEVIAEEFWRHVMGGTSCFGSEILYVKKIGRGKQRRYDILCAARWDTGTERTIVERATSIIAPSWYTTEQHNRAILFSEVKATHVGLMLYDKGRVRSVALPQADEGTVVGVTQHPENETFVYCHSGNLWRYEKNAVRGKVIYRKFTDPEGPCICPTLLSNGDVIYGAQDKIKRWEKATNTISILINEGYCVAPTCHENTGIIVYSRRTQGIMQLWMYDMVRQVKRQLTKGPGDKTDPSISPCGNFVAFCHEKKAGSCICILNIVTGDIRTLTPANQCCAYPAWSPARAVA